MFRVTLKGGVRKRLLFFSLGLAISTACANGGDGGGAPGGDDGGVPPGDDGAANADAQPDGAAADGEGGSSGTSAQKACADDAAEYCSHLETCAPFKVTALYNDQLTCIARRTVGCLDQLQAPGTGWTGDRLEACIAARKVLPDCASFLYGKPAPAACRVSGSIPNSNPCRYDAQCGGAYCRYAANASCGTCVGLGATGAPCAQTSDCDGNLVCALSGGSGTCQPPVGAGGACDATHPCQLGLACISATCAAPGGLGATCAAANGNADCSYDQGVYCDATSSTCKAYATAQATNACGSSQPTVCVGDGTCYQNHCVAPIQDGATCNPQQGQNCMPPSSCTAGTCGLYSASQCK
jgi:hypothetical protein